MKADIRDEIASRFIEALEAGTIPWRKPWNGGNNRPRNAISNKPYRGLNSLFLGMLADAKGYPTGQWITLNQCLKNGGRVIREEFDQGTNVLFWKFITKEEMVNGRKVRSTFPLCRSFRVWNVAQCTGLTLKVVETPHVEPIEAAQKIVDGMPNAPTIRVMDTDRACYIPGRDVVEMPQLSQFHSAAGYYSTMFHELAHATGHKSRLNRDGVMESKGFGSDSYSREELVAEIAASFLNAEAGTLDQVQENSAAYVQNWAARLTKEPRLIVDAASAAQKAADYILGYSYTAEKEED